MGSDDVLDDCVRYFSVLGAGYCGVGSCPVPDSLAAVIDWVEKRVPPDVLPTTSIDAQGSIRHRDICRYSWMSNMTEREIPTWPPVIAALGARVPSMLTYRQMAASSQVEFVANCD